MRPDAELLLWQFLAKHLRAQQKALLLIVAESIGSSPGRAGFKMAIAADGALCGSVGGGIMEKKLTELAKKRLEQGEEAPLLKRQIHRKTVKKDQSGMICSGEQTILFITLAPSDRKQVQIAIQCLKRFIPAILQVTETGLQVLPKQKNEQTFYFERLPDQSFLFEENLGFKHQLYIVGGGHCALALSELMSKLDFYLCLFDERADLNTFAQNRFVHQKHVLENYHTIGEWIPSGNDVYVVVMTVGYRTDEVVIRQLAGREFAYFGVLGSNAKMQALLNQLRREGIPEWQLKRLHTPIGLKINSRTPEEIAVSIAGEIIAVKNAHSRKTE